MNVLAKQFSFYPKDIVWYTAIIALQCSRMSIFNSYQTMGAESVSNSVILLLLCITLNFYVVYRERHNLSEAIKGTKILFLYFIFGFFSVFWSPVPRAMTVLPKCLEVISSYLMIAVVLYKIKDKNVCLVYLLQLCTIASLIGYVPGLLNGQIWQHSSFFPMTGAMGCLLAWGIKKNYHFKYINYYLGINFAIMLFGTSSTTFIAFACGMFVLLSSKDSGIKIINLILISLLFLIIYYFLKDEIFNFIFQGKSDHSIQSASGREYIWNHAIDAWKSNPWLGSGFIVAERNLHLIANSNVQILSTHNGYLSVLLGTGIVGTVIFGIFYIKTLFICVRSSFSEIIGREMTILFPLLVVLSVNNLSVHAVGGAWDISSPSVFALLILINTLNLKEA